jgi:ribosomal protein S18 acetylase RimI-like enzyme
MRSPLHDVRVVPLRTELLGDVVRIHKAGLGYTMNSRLGDDHLAFLYQFMATDEASYVGVALMNQRAVGVVSGTADASGLNSRLLGAMSMGRRVRVALRFLSRPRLIWELWKAMQIARPVMHEGKQVSAVLTTISVDPSCQARGIGAQLVAALERYLAGRGILNYRLDTLLENHAAREFYRKLGFCEVESREDSTVFLRTIPQ